MIVDKLATIDIFHEIRRMPKSVVIPTTKEFYWTCSGTVFGYF